MSSPIVEWIKKVNSRFGVGMGKSEPTAYAFDLPDDWLEIRIPYQRQDLSCAQWKAIRKSGSCQRPLIYSDRNSKEELSLEEQIGRLATLRQGQQETAIHICRRAIPTKHTDDDRYGEARNKRAVETINEMLAAFPDEQIEIARISDFELAKREKRTVEISRESGSEEDEEQ